MASASQRETLAFDFYVRRVAPELSGEFDSQFWAGLVPRLCQAEPAIRHAVFALGSVYRALAESDKLLPPAPGDPATTFSIAEYNKAISSLLSLDAGRTSGQEPTAIYLLACILFVCIEFLMGNEMSSHSHIHQGRRLLRRLDEGGARRASPQMEFIRRELVPIYSRLAVTSFTWGQTPEEIPPRMNLHVEVPTEFTSSDEARACLYSAIDDALRTSKDVRIIKFGRDGEAPAPPDLQAAERMHQDVLSRLKSWNVAFTLYLASRSAVGGRQGPSPGERVMCMYYHVAYIWVSNSFSATETSYDDYMEHFTSVVSHASSMQLAAPEARSASPASSAGASPHSSTWTASDASPSPPPFGLDASGPRRGRAFMFHDNAIPPLYYVAFRCRHPRLRRTALSLLEQLSHISPREALWDARELVPVAKKVIEIEEEKGEVELGDGRLSDKPPFGLSDDVRLREVLIGDKGHILKDPNGTWITIFRKPSEPDGQFVINREWVQFSTGS